MGLPMISQPLYVLSRLLYTLLVSKDSCQQETWATKTLQIKCFDVSYEKD